MSDRSLVSVVKAMHQQVRELKVDQQGLALRGVLVRHLVMPGSHSIAFSDSALSPS
jgi:hypothetical protein